MLSQTNHRIITADGIAIYPHALNRFASNHQHPHAVFVHPRTVKTQSPWHLSSAGTDQPKHYSKNMAMKAQEAVKEYMSWGRSDTWMAEIPKSECVYASAHGQNVGSACHLGCRANAKSAQPVNRMVGWR
jgi:hypothetical protein